MLQNSLNGLIPSLPFFTWLKYIRGAISNSLASNNDVYTVPSGKKAIVTSGRIYNTNVATAVTYFNLKVSGTYYRISPNTSTSTGAGSNVNVGIIWFILNAWESISLDSDKTGVNCNIAIVEFNDSVPVNTAKILSLSNGNNTLYTVPSGKSTVLLNLITLVPNSNVQVANFSGGSLNYIYYAVPNGGTPDSTNQVLPSTANANRAVLSNNTIWTMNAWDFIVVNTSSGNSGQTAWLNYYELSE